uniref:Uncharacterized protein n=1 Tax=Amphimedon queenslandica TaxID=400682 RepID=A0A1X7TMB7_AMPQE
MLSIDSTDINFEKSLLDSGDDFEATLLLRLGANSYNEGNRQRQLAILSEERANYVDQQLSEIGDSITIRDNSLVVVYNCETRSFIQVLALVLGSLGELLLRNPRLSVASAIVFGGVCGMAITKLLMNIAYIRFIFTMCFAVGGSVGAFAGITAFDKLMGYPGGYYHRVTRYRIAVDVARTLLGIVLIFLLFITAMNVHFSMIDSFISIRYDYETHTVSVFFGALMGAVSALTVGPEPMIRQILSGYDTRSSVGLKVLRTCIGIGTGAIVGSIALRGSVGAFAGTTAFDKLMGYPALMEAVSALTVGPEPIIGQISSSGYDTRSSVGLGVLRACSSVARVGQMCPTTIITLATPLRACIGIGTGAMVGSVALNTPEYIILKNHLADVVDLLAGNAPVITQFSNHIFSSGLIPKEPLKAAVAQSPTVIQLSSKDEVARNIDKLYDQFTDLVTDLRTRFEELTSENKVKLIQVTRQAADYLKIRVTSLQADSIDELFDSLQPHYDFLNCSLLRKLTNKFLGGDKLQLSLSQYIDSMDKLLESSQLKHIRSTIKERLSFLPAPTTNKHTVLVVFELHSRWEEMTLENFKSVLKHYFGSNADLFSHIYFDYGSLVVKMLIPTSIYQFVTDTLIVKRSSMNGIGIFQVAVNGRTVLSIDSTDINFEKSLINSRDDLRKQCY